MILTDQYGFEYYDFPRHSWKLAKNIWPFVEVNPSFTDFYKVKIGMKFIIYSRLRGIYEQYEIREDTIDEDLIPYINQKRLYYIE